MLDKGQCSEEKYRRNTVQIQIQYNAGDKTFDGRFVSIIGATHLIVQQVTLYRTLHFIETT